MRLLFDIEGNGLLPTVSIIWMVCVTDLDTKEKYVFCDGAFEAGVPGARPTIEFRHLFDRATSLTGHFILGYDLPALKKVLNYEPPKHVKIIDTMIMSQVLNYKRFPGARHSLKVWGEHLGYPKVVHEEWDKYSPEMLHRCEVDVEINLKVLEKVTGELKRLMDKKPYLAKSLRVEHDVLEFCSLAEQNGWLFDIEGAEKLVEELAVRMKEIEDEVEPMLKVETKLIDKEPKNPKWIKSGNYDAHTARYFGITPDRGKEEFPPIWGPYQRFEYVQPDLGNIDSVKGLLYSFGWEPDDWNWTKGANGRPEKGSPKLTSTSLALIGPVGEKLDTYYTLRSRHQIVSGWIANVDRRTRRVHGECFTIATPTGRARHNGIVNVPSADGKSLYGKEIRKLFITEPGWKIIGADSAGNQMRAFCHYLGNEEYTNEVLNGDVHTKNMLILQEIVPTAERGKHAKPFLYAFLFGGGSEKLGLILTGKRDAKIGKRAKDRFAEKTPGLKQLIQKIGAIYERTSEVGDAWIPALDGRRIYTDSPHKSLNYLLQSCEAITCKAAVSQIMRKLREENIPWRALIFYHDEVEFEVPEAFAERAAIIAKEAFRDAPKEFGVMIMDGEAKIGDSWYDVH
jgi:DNA polymerase I-like protein with 3'-5' exonuclease and polymerase domains